MLSQNLQVAYIDSAAACVIQGREAARRIFSKAN
jgi:hypothetical protein